MNVKIADIRRQRGRPGLFAPLEKAQRPAASAASSFAREERPSDASTFGLERDKRRRVVRTRLKRTSFDIESDFDDPLIDRRLNSDLAKNVDRVSVDFLDLRAASLAPILQRRRQGVRPGECLQNFVENPIDISLGIDSS